MEHGKNIHPVFDKTLTREEREQKLHQKAKVIWLMGLSGSGKSTIAVALERALYNLDFTCMILDGDNMRTGINNNLGFSDTDRIENIRRVSETAKLFFEAGIVTICSFITPLETTRESIEKIVGKENFLLIFVDTPLEECEKRDVKGLYAKARRGEIKDFTGINAPFEKPKDASLTILTENKTIDQSFEEVLSFILPLIKSVGSGSN